MTNWFQFCRRTEDPKLRYIEHRLDLLGIRRNGHSFHAPILEVPDEFSDQAWDLLGEMAEGPDGTLVRLDDLEDDDAGFTEEPF